MRNRFTQLFLVNALTCGLEICMAAGTSFVPPLLLEAGVEERFMTMVLGVGPVLGLLFVPLIGAASDGWKGRFGRRRPFIWLLCLGVLLSLLLIPQASRLATLLSIPMSVPLRGLEVALLVAGICLMEFCGQVCFTPLEALVSDLFQEEEECTWAFSVYSLMISLGGCVGYLLPAVHWNMGPLIPYLGGQRSFIFLLLTLIFLACLLGTLFISEESDWGKVASREGVPSICPRLCPHLPSLRPYWLLSLLRGCRSLLPQLCQACRRMPSVIRRLFVAELWSWMALMTFILFYTDFVGEALYQGVPSAPPGSAERLRYEEGVRMGSLGLFLQCATSVLLSLCIETLVRWLGRRAVYLSSVVLLALATLVMSLSRSVVTVTLMAALTGYPFCILQILPYTLTSLYHNDKQTFFPRTKDRSKMAAEEKWRSAKDLVPHILYHGNGHPGGMPGLGPTMYVSITREGPPSPAAVAPTVGRGMCLDLAILDSAFLLSQVVSSLLMGSVVQYTGSVSAYMGGASVFALVAIYFSSRVVFDRRDLER
ncbi:solute carrier family 45 member 3 [Amia ocellicauda]|uniref:solute carrier family 45 member 3 n=1 Tax=Amia ocellicauda TaxID=2972642 RepID=UPI003463E7A5